MYLTQGLHRSLQRHPDKPALRHVGDGDVRDHSFAGLLSDIARHAAALQARGVRPGDRVALLAPNHDRLVRALFACWWLGAVACPLNVRWSAPELAYALSDSGASLLVVDQALAGGGRDLALPVIDFEQLAHEAQGMQALPDVRAGGDTLAAILYTGGTTGRSKGVMLSHANFWTASMTRGAELNNAPDSVSLLVAPLFHVAGLGRLVGQTLVGGTCVTMAHFKPGAVLEAIERHGISDVIVVPTMLQSLLDDPGFAPERVRSLNRIAFGAAPMPPDLLERALQAWPHAEFFQAYGLTETAGAVCINLPDNHRNPAALAQGRLNSVGRAGLGAEIQIVDESGRELPPGQAGMVLFRSPNLFSGFLDEADNRKAFTADGWLATGDLGWLDEQGRLNLTGRAKDLIIRSGHNIDPKVIEDALDAHPAVQLAAAVGAPDAYAGEVPVAYATLLPGASATEEELLAFVAQRVDEAPARPKRITVLQRMPTTNVGKIFKPELRQLAAIDTVQQRLQALWREAAPAGLPLPEVLPEGPAGLLLRAPDHPAWPTLAPAVADAVARLGVQARIA